MWKGGQKKIVLSNKNISKRFIKSLRSPVCLFLSTCTKFTENRNDRLNVAVTLDNLQFGKKGNFVQKWLQKKNLQK